jgi:hypothetical protein
MTYVAPSTVTTLQTYTSAAHNVIVGDIIDHETRIANSEAAWTSFTPALGGGFANGNASVSGKYLQVGKTVSFWAFIAFGTTTTKGAVLRVSLPVAAAVLDISASITINVIDVSAGWFPMFAINGSSTSNVEVLSYVTSGTYATGAQTTATVPFTWNTDDVIRYGGTYEAA